MKISTEGQRAKVINFGLTGSAPENVIVYLDESVLDFLKQQNRLDDLENLSLLINLEKRTWEVSANPPTLPPGVAPNEAMAASILFHQGGQLLAKNGSSEVTCSL